MSNERTTSVASGGISLGSICLLLTIVFVILKMTGVISWSWFWVLFPIIFSFGLGILTVLVILVCVAITAIIIWFRLRR